MGESGNGAAKIGATRQSTPHGLRSSKPRAAKKGNPNVGTGKSTGKPGTGKPGTGKPRSGARVRQTQKCIDATGGLAHLQEEGRRWRGFSDLARELPARTGTPKLTLEWLHRKFKGTQISVQPAADFPRDSRVLLSADRFLGSGLKLALERECNGVVLHLEERRPLAVPPASFRYLREHERDQQALQALKRPGTQVFEAVDGTLVTLYRHQGRACLASARRIDIGDSHWVGPRTYADVVSDVVDLAQLGPELDGWSVTLLLSHPEFHPLTTATSLQIVHAHNYLTGADVLPSTTITGRATAWETLCALPVQHEVGTQVADAEVFLDSMKRVADGALEEYHARGVAKYGYIIRQPAHDGTVGSGTALFIESDLMRTLRQFVYMPVPPKITDATTGAAIVVDNTNRLEYLALHAYLGFYGPDRLAVLEPRFAPFFERFRPVFATLYDEILDQWRDQGGSERAAAVIRLVLAGPLSLHVPREPPADPAKSRPTDVALVRSLLQAEIRNPDSQAMALIFWMFTARHP